MAMMARRSITGMIHSLESMTAVDGPGLRFLVFMQGCYRRCAFCSNPDTWKLQGGKPMTVDEVMAHLARNLPYLKPHGGGLTCSGGEPLVQGAFVKELFEGTRELGLTTCLDTSGMGQVKFYDSILANTDYAMLCTKSLDPARHRAISGADIGHMLRFVGHLDAAKTPFHVRHVLVPEGPLQTSDAEELERVSEFINARDHCTGIELLPYHRLGSHKWEAMGLKYPLKDMRTPSKEEVQSAVDALRASLKDGKRIVL